MNHPVVIESLLENSANIEAQDEQKCTPLHLACKKGSQECVELLLRRGANIMAQDNRKWTSLHYGAYNGQPRAVNYVMKKEADFDKLYDIKNSQSKTAFMISKSENVKKAFNHIWKACKQGDLDMVRILIREGQDMNQKTFDRENSPMHIAARHGHYLIVKFLLDNGAAITTNNMGQTPFQYMGEVIPKEINDPAKMNKLIQKQCKNKGDEHKIK
mmetsp:Transcript_17521/g.29542  ORF Transcript_17521/g.29542 Transcript_17521/m.29542 type:complete len:215 (+) Transcript_17521:1438-2082(+)